MRMGGGPQQFGIDAEQVPDVLRRSTRGRARHPAASTSSPARRTSNAAIIAEAQRRTVDLVSELAEHLTDAGALPQPRRRLRHPVHREGPAARSRRRRGQPARASSTGRSPSGCPRRRRSSSSAATSSASAASTSRACSTARSPAARPTSSSTAGCTTSWRHPATSGRRSAATTRSSSATGSTRRRATRTSTVVGCLCTPLDLLGDDVELPAGRHRRPHRDLPAGRLRPDRQPDRVPRTPCTRRGPRLTLARRENTA